MQKPPLILTVMLDASSTAVFNALRQQHFPAARNFIDAHLTLFHALPNEGFIVDTVREISSVQAPFSIAVAQPASIGKGVAYKLESNELMRLHGGLRQRWQAFLTAQDNQKLWPHITIQNKVSPADARALLSELLQTFEPYCMDAIGLQLWEYLDGPWRLLEAFVFSG